MDEEEWRRVKALSESINPNHRRNEMLLAKAVLELKKEIEHTREYINYYDGNKRPNTSWLFDEIK